MAVAVKAGAFSLSKQEQNHGDIPRGAGNTYLFDLSEQLLGAHVADAALAIL